MSLADDKSLLAMKAARMSLGSIAYTMGWSERRVERRLAELEAAEAVAQPRPPVTPERAPAPTPVRKAAPKPAARPRPSAGASRGLVTRTFALYGGGRGAAVLLDDARVVFTETGHARPELLDEVDVTAGDGCFHLVPADDAKAAA